MMVQKRHPALVLNEQLELLRVRLVEQFGSSDKVPYRIREAYFGAALSGLELADWHGVAQVISTLHSPHVAQA